MHTARHHIQAKRDRYILVSERLGEEEETVEAHREVAVEEARTRAKSLLVGDQPEMNDVAWDSPGCHQIANQRVISAPSALRRHGVLVVASFEKAIAFVHQDDSMPLFAKSSA